MNESISVSIVVPIFNALKYIGPFLDSIRKLNFPKSKFETIIVDNGSEDKSLEFIEKNYPEVILIKANKNLGFAEGCNVGVRKARGKYVSIQNIDVIVDKDWIRELFDFMEDNPKHGLVGQRMIDSNKEGKYEFGGYDVPTLMQFHVKAKEIDKDTTKPFELFGTAAPFYRRELVDVPFDPDYFMYGEDTYFTWLTLLRGYRTAVIPKSFFYHVGSTTVKSMDKDFFFTYMGERNRLLNFFIFFELKTIIKLIPMLFITITIYNLFDIRNALPRLKSYLWIISNYKTVSRKRKHIQSKREVSDLKITRFMSSKLFDESLSEDKTTKRLIKLFNKLSNLYCRLMNIKTREFYNA
jgi:hypothetical protein